MNVKKNQLLKSVGFESLCCIDKDLQFACHLPCSVHLVRSIHHSSFKDPLPGLYTIQQEAWVSANISSFPF